jgi:hypothetical protein
VVAVVVDAEVLVGLDLIAATAEEGGCLPVELVDGNRNGVPSKPSGGNKGLVELGLSLDKL